MGRVWTWTWKTIRRLRQLVPLNCAKSTCLNLVSLSMQRECEISRVYRDHGLHFFLFCHPAWEERLRYPSFILCSLWTIVFACFFVQCHRDVWIFRPRSEQHTSSFPLRTVLSVAPRRFAHYAKVRDGQAGGRILLTNLYFLWFCAKKPNSAAALSAELETVWRSNLNVTYVALWFPIKAESSPRRCYTRFSCPILNLQSFVTSAHKCFHQLITLNQQFFSHLKLWNSKRKIFFCGCGVSNLISTTDISSFLVSFHVTAFPRKVSAHLVVAIFYFFLSVMTTQRTGVMRVTQSSCL